MAVAGALVVVGVARMAPSQAANFSLKPASGPVGTTFTASGDGYANCFGDWVVVWDQPRTEYGRTTPPPSAPADSHSATVVVPAGATVGTHVVSAICDFGSGEFSTLDRATFVVTETTTVPPPTTATTAPPTTRGPQGSSTTRGLFIVPTSPPPSPTTTRPSATTSTTRPGATTTSSAPTSTTTSLLPPPTTIAPNPPGLVALTPHGKSSGPPGVTLTITGTGYEGCDHVYFFFDGRRIGSASPDRSGTVRLGGVSVPGDVHPGPRPVTSSCHRDGELVRRTATFTVLDVGLHRAALLTALPQPRHVSLDPGRLVLSAAIALFAIALIAFPYQLFNSTLEENYEEVRSWFGLKPKPPGYVPPHQGVLFAVFVVVSGLLYAFLSPDFGLNRTTLVVTAGLGLAILVTGVGFALPAFVYMRARVGERGHLRVLPGSVVVAALTVLLSRAVGYTPGYVYGLLAVFVFGTSLSREREGRLATVTSVVILALCLAAWVLRVPVSGAAGDDHPNALLLILEAALGGIFLLGLESLLVDLLPLRFLDGSRIKAWSRGVWAALVVLGMFLLVHVLIAPGSGYVGRSENLKLRIVVVVLYLAFGAGSVAFWAYFRFRPARWSPVSEDADATSPTVPLR